MSADLILRLLVIHAAVQCACAWLQAFQTPWPLAGAFELADSFEEQLFKSLGISFSNLKEALDYKVVLSLVAIKLSEAGFCRKRMLSTGRVVETDTPGTTLSAFSGLVPSN